jgi:hypothetical protein
VDRVLPAQARASSHPTRRAFRNEIVEVVDGKIVRRTSTDNKAEVAPAESN